MAERARPTADATSVGVHELWNDYNAWCLANELSATTIEIFGGEFDRVREMPELAGKIRKLGNRYYGISLVTHASLSAPKRQSG